MRVSQGISLALAFAVSVGASGCTVRSTPALSRTIDVSERDFKIVAPKTVHAGTVTIRVHNKGPDAHELILVRVRPLAALPLRTDGMTLDEDALERDTVGGLEPGAPDSVRTLRVHLKPGTYELFCNMSGHFMGGMATRMVAR